MMSQESFLEKPLGFNSKSSKKINDEISEYFHESQIFRIDHYLGKETVQFNGTSIYKWSLRECLEL